jgi:hypothetical protein
VLLACLGERSASARELDGVTSTTLPSWYVALQGASV